jgi:hypothetical protein
VTPDLDDSTHDDSSLNFIKSCILKKSVIWTYHVNMRMENRFISRQTILSSLESFEIIEAYPDDKYLPSYLVFSNHDNIVFHILFAIDVQNENVRIVTVYRPDPQIWEKGLKRRKKL